MANPTTEMIYQFIRTYIEQHGYSPSQREIADGCYISLGSVYNHLIRLEIQGRIYRDPGKSRSIHIVTR